MAYKVFVDGQEGTTGLRINEYLAARSDVEVLRIDADKRKDAAERSRLLNAADVAFLCLPDAASREAAFMVNNPNTCLIDASTAHRTAPGWAFGLPELAKDQRNKIRASKRIANPGCHASAFILAVRPLVSAGLLAPEALISATSITGYSGGGKNMIAEYEAGGNAKLSSPRPYALGLSHKHLPEMMAHTGLTNAPVFMPIVGSFYKGLAVTVPLHLSQLRGGAKAEQVHAALAEYYAGERFIRVMPLRDADTLAEGFFDVQACNDTNRVDLFVFGSETQVLVIARLDNLGKGASGAAVQSMNVHLGVDEGLGLLSERHWVQDLTPEDAGQVSAGVIAYGRALAAGGQAQEISCGLYEGDRLIAGAVGRTEFRRLFVSYLWVDEELRGQGIGTDVLRRLEAQALKRGCVDALIETLSDRNAELYERLGYAMMAHVHDYVPGFTRYILIKVWKPRD